MARTARNPKLDTRNARGGLKKSRAPYWTSISPGHSLGYRKGKKVGTWLAKLILDDLRQENRIGPADDMLDADGFTIFSFAQAQERARKWFEEIKRDEHHVNIDTYTVSEALDDYLEHYSREGRSLGRVECNIRLHIRPQLGHLAVKKLTKRRIDAWLKELSETPAMVRSRKGGERRYKDVTDDPDAKRRCRVKANRQLVILKAALNFAANEFPSLSDEAWRRVKSFRRAERARVRHLSDDESRRLVNACKEPFRSLVLAGLLTGARYGELARLTAGDYNPDAGTIHIRDSKSGKDRHVYLSPEGARHFTRQAVGKGSQELLFTRANKESWGPSHQQRVMKVASENAKIKPAVTFHVLRHCYASRSVMRKIELMVVARQLGHSDTRMGEKHYGHLAPNYVADTVRKNFTDMGLVKNDNVVPITTGG
jgi:integrase